MLEAITFYLLKIGGPIAIVSTGMFFLLKHYVTERIKSDFENKLEAVRQTNKTSIEVLRATMQKDLESIKSSLEISRTTTHLLIERRIRYYEEFFEVSHVLYNAVTEVKVAVQSFQGQTREQYLDAAQVNLFSAHQKFLAWSATRSAFIQRKVGVAIVDVFQTMNDAADAATKLDLPEMKKKTSQFLSQQVEVEEMIRDDLMAIQKSGKLDYD